MAKKDSATEESSEDVTAEVIKSIKKISKNNVIYELGSQNSPSEVKNWLPTGIKVLDVIISNKKDGGWPSGRISELLGDNSSGKSLLALLTAVKCQKDGGYVVWCDTENAFSEDLARMFDLDVTKRFMYLQPSCIDEVFTYVEGAILKLRQLKPDGKLLIVWDSVAQTPSREELEGDYVKKGFSKSPMELGLGFRKISNIIGKLDCVFLCLNQIRMNIGNPFQPTITPGGKALPFISSVRVEMTKSSLIRDKDKDVIGNVIRAKVIKNKVGPAYRKCDFKMLYTRGVDESECIFDVLVKIDYISKKGSWYYVGEDKFQGKEEFIKRLKSDKDFNDKAMDAFYAHSIKIYGQDSTELVEEEDGIVRDPETGEILYNAKQEELDELLKNKNSDVQESD